MAKKNKNKGIFYVIILVILIIIGLYFKYYKTNTTLINENPAGQNNTQTNPISITTKNIKEKNFTGKVSVISGESLLATTAQDFIEKTVADFKKQADTDVPDMRAKFGPDSPTAQYEIDIEAKEVNSAKTQSIVMSQYFYTGGANGNSLYKVFTASRESGEILTLSSIIRKDKQDSFTAFIKKELNAWRPDGADISMLFPDEIKNLTFSSFVNWSMDDRNLIIYFDKYQIGAGALGPVAFPIPITKIKDLLN